MRIFSGKEETGRSAAVTGVRVVFFVVYISNYRVVNISNLLYKIKNSFLLNIIYYFLLEFIYKFVKIQGNHKLKK